MWSKGVCVYTCICGVIKCVYICGVIKGVCTHVESFL